MRQKRIRPADDFCRNPRSRFGSRVRPEQARSQSFPCRSTPGARPDTTADNADCNLPPRQLGEARQFSAARRIREQHAVVMTEASFGKCVNADSTPVPFVCRAVDAVSLEVQVTSTVRNSLAPVSSGLGRCRRRQFVHRPGCRIRNRLA